MSSFFVLRQDEDTELLLMQTGKIKIAEYQPYTRSEYRSVVFNPTHILEVDEECLVLSGYDSTWLLLDSLTKEDKLPRKAVNEVMRTNGGDIADGWPYLPHTWRDEIQAICGTSLSRWVSMTTTPICRRRGDVWMQERPAREVVAPCKNRINHSAYSGIRWKWPVESITVSAPKGLRDYELLVFETPPIEGSEEMLVIGIIQPGSTDLKMYLLFNNGEETLVIHSLLIESTLNSILPTQQKQDFGDYICDRAHELKKRGPLMVEGKRTLTRHQKRHQQIYGKSISLDDYLEIGLHIWRLDPMTRILNQSGD